MLQIDNHKELALSRVIPYLLQFPEIYKLAEQSGDRNQIIEDIAWQLLYNLDFENANGVWLDYIGTKVGQDRTYIPKATDAFRFGGTVEEGFGRGKFKPASSLRNTKVARTDSSFRNAIRAKIIQNNTDTSLDELKQACKLLFNAGKVTIKETYPANISEIIMYGGALIETLDAMSVIKTLLPAGVSLSHLTFLQYYNLFKNNAFIAYDTVIPEKDDFSLSFTLKPDVESITRPIGLFSQNTTFASDLVPIVCFYDPNEGIVFKASPDYYSDSDTGIGKYEDETGEYYLDSDSSIVLTGGTIAIDSETSIKITRTGNIWRLYVNNVLIDEDEDAHEVAQGEGMQLFLGLSEDLYYNSGSMYNLLLQNTTTGELLINDPLRVDTIGNNNGVRFL